MLELIAQAEKQIRDWDGKSGKSGFERKDCDPQHVSILGALHTPHFECDLPAVGRNRGVLGRNRIARRHEHPLRD